jgi:hypothetical protein
MYPRHRLSWLRFMFPGTWRRVVLWIGNNVPDEPAAQIVKAEEGFGIFGNCVEKTPSTGLLCLILKFLFFYSEDGSVRFPVEGRYSSILTRISDIRRGFGSVSRFIGYSPVGTTISYNTFNLTVTIALRNYEQRYHSEGYCNTKHFASDVFFWLLCLYITLQRPNVRHRSQQLLSSRPSVAVL